jgi:hypothetical protein
MAQDVPLMLARPDVTLAQVRRVFGALDQAHFVKQLANVLEETGYDFAVVDAARALQISLPNWRRLRSPGQQYIKQSNASWTSNMRPNRSQFR